MIVEKDKGFILSSQKYSEDSLIIKIFTEKYGVVKGLLKKSIEKKNIFHYQVGNYIEFQWSAKNETDLGNFNIEIIDACSSFILLNNLNLILFNFAVILIDNSIAEHQEVKSIFKIFKNLVFYMKDSNTDNILNLINLMFVILENLGCGLDLSKCALTNREENLYYISPKTGRAVTKKAGEEYKSKLFVIPVCFKEYCLDRQDLLNAVDILFYFIKKFFEENNMDYKISNIDFCRKELIKIAKNVYI